MTVIKICGLREAAHALVAAEAGADLLGFNFVPGVRRRLEVEHARAIIEEFGGSSLLQDGAACVASPRIVGLFANQPLSEVNHIIARCGLDLAQLCGDEERDYWRQVDADVIRQVRIDDTAPHSVAVEDALRRVEEASSAGCIPLLDKQEAGQLGGTGRTFDWRHRQGSCGAVRRSAGGRPDAGQRAAGHCGGVSVGRRRVQRSGDGRREGPWEDSGVYQKRGRLRASCHLTGEGFRATPAPFTPILTFPRQGGREVGILAYSRQGRRDMGNIP